MHSQDKLPYLRFKISLKLSKKPWSQLNEHEKNTVNNEAEQEHKIQQAILKSKQAVTVTLETAELERALSTIRNRFSSEQSFLKDLNKEGLNPDILRYSLEDELRVEAIMAKVASQAEEPTELEISKFYQTHQDHFHTTESRTARHILITINPEFQTNTRKESHQRIKKICKILKKDPAQFTAMVKKYSECPTSLKDGNLGDIRPGQLYPELEKALFALTPNSISPPIETEMGFHLVICDAIHPAEIINQERATSKIRQILEQKKQSLYLKQWLKKL
ncbi:MAG: nitrogen fixation protein NifM [Desulfobulbaceae bacterium]|nr:nitrogen fixation protein NifM [Desulfobulbaceae bacterium]